MASLPSPSSSSFHIGPIELRAYGLMIALGVLVAIWWCQKRWENKGGEAEEISEIMIWAVPFGLVGARLYHVITDWRSFRGRWEDAPAIWQGGLGIPGGLILGVIVGVTIAKKRGINTAEVLDAVIPSIPVAQAIGRWGNWFNQELFGKPTELPWALEIDYQHRPNDFTADSTFHPTFLYEAVWNLLLAFLFIIAFLFMTFFEPAAKFKEHKEKSKRPLKAIITQGSFIVAVSAATTGYVVMSFIMTATPVSMHVMDGHSLHHTKLVLQSHVIAMFLPSLFTAYVVKYIGLTRMMLIGVLFLFVSVLIAFMSHALTNYWWSLVLLGLGWNFLFIGGTNLLPQAYNENEKFKVQSINDFLVFGFQAFAALSAGWFVFNFSWEVVLLSVLPLLLLQLVVLVWWFLKKTN